MAATMLGSVTMYVSHGVTMLGNAVAMLVSVATILGNGRYVRQCHHAQP